MYRSSSHQYRTPYHSNPFYKKEDPMNRNNYSNIYANPIKLNWQKNVICKNDPSTNVHREDLQPHQPFPTRQQNFNKTFDTPRDYKLITSDKALWPYLTQSLDVIAMPSTIKSFQYVLDLIQRQAAFHSGGRCDISLLDHFLKSLPDKEKQLLQTKVFPEMATLILKTSNIFPNPNELAMLPQGCNENRTLTREQCACLLAHMFMCSTLKQSSSLLPLRYNFSELYSRTCQSEKNAVKLQKIACLINYFKKITMSPPNKQETVTFSRVCYDERTHRRSDLTAWTKLADILPEVEIDSKRKIEDTQNAVEVDFANKYLGGGVLGSGSVQEEIQFITRPEQLIGLLFCEAMTDKEAILIRGAKIYSGYKGYASTFMFDALSPFSTGNDYSVREREVIAIDAKDFSNTHYTSQFREEEILRELNKAYIGFVGDSKKPISTGNWGCGCFKGDAQLKFLIQWMAASRAGRKIIFHPVGTTDPSGFQNIVKFYRGQNIGKLLNDVLKCSSAGLMVNKGRSLFEMLTYGKGPMKYPGFR